MQFSLKYRPTRFSEVVGQSVATRILANSIKLNKVPTALVLFGLHGCGKTTLARIYAKALNCEAFNGEPCCTCISCRAIQAGTSLSVLEYDAASHSGVDDARTFKDLVTFKIFDTYRVIILDECHMFTKQAQAALLKLIEEPPKNTVFILVTTDVSRLEATMLSRCLKVDLRPVGGADLVKNIEHILASEGVQCTPGFATRLAQQGLGSVRDMQQILEQLVLRSDGELTEALLTDTFGLISTQTYKDLAYALNTKNTVEFFKIIRNWYNQGIDLVNLFMQGIPRLVHDFMMCVAGADDIEYYSGIKKATLAKNLNLTYAEIKHILCAWDADVEFMRNTIWPKIIWDKFAVGLCDH